MRPGPVGLHAGGLPLALRSAAPQAHVVCVSREKSSRACRCGAVLLHPAALRLRKLGATTIAADNRVGDFTLGPGADNLLRERKDSAYVGVIRADDRGTTC